MEHKNVAHLNPYVSNSAPPAIGPSNSLKHNNKIIVET